MSKVLIAIHGSHSQPEQMEAQRDTWLKELDGSVADYRFFLGKARPCLKPETCGKPIDGERVWCSVCTMDEQYLDDVVYIDSPDGPLFSDTKKIHRTWHLNRKTEALCEYALESGYDYLFKCDDDTYVRTEMLLESGFEEHDYCGFTDTHYTRELGWYRWAQGGAGYWLSRYAMEIIVREGLRLIPAEDFAVGNALAANAVHPHHDKRYNPNVTVRQLDSPEALESYITLHKVKAEAMYRLHSRVL